MHRVFHAGFLFLHFGFGRGADFDYGYATDQLRQPLLQLLAVVVAGGLVDLAANFLHAAFDLAVLALALDDGRVVLVDGDFLGLAEIGHLDVLKLDAEVFGDGFAAGQDCDVLQHGLATVAESRGLHGRHVQRAAQLVDHQGRQRFAFHVFSDDHERTAALCDLLEQREQVFHRRDLLLVNQDVGVFLHRLHALRISHEVRGQVAAVELHAFDHFQLGFHRLRFFHRDDAVFADLLHGLGNDVADGRVVIGGNCANLRDHVAGDLLRQLVEGATCAVTFVVDGATNSGNGLLDAALQGHRVRAGSHGLHAFAIDRLCQNGRGGGAVAGHVRGLRRHFAHHLRAHVLERVLQLDFFGYGHAVFGDERRTELLLDNYVAALGTEGDLHGIRQDIHSPQDGLPRLFTVQNLLCHFSFLLRG